MTDCFITTLLALIDAGKGELRRMVCIYCISSEFVNKTNKT